MDLIGDVSEPDCVRMVFLCYEGENLDIQFDYNSKRRFFTLFSSLIYGKLSQVDGPRGSKLVKCPVCDFMNPCKTKVTSHLKRHYKYDKKKLTTSSSVI